MTNRDLDHAIDRIARRQHGVFSRTQAVTSGATAKMVRSRVTAGRWRRVDNAVYALPSHETTWHQRAMAATLGNPGAVVSGKTAAALHGIQGFKPGAIEITVPRGQPHVSRLAIVRRSDHVRAVRVEGIPVNSALVTWFDLVSSMSRDQADATLEDAMRKHLFRFDQLATHFVRWQQRRRPGVGMARELIEKRDEDYTPSASELERMLYDTFDIDEFQPYLRQAVFPWRPRSGERLDGLVVVGDVITEADGRVWHEQVDTMANDRRRDREAIQHGHLPLRWMWTDLRDDQEQARQVVRNVQALALRRTCSVA